MKTIVNHSVSGAMSFGKALLTALLISGSVSLAQTDSLPQEKKLYNLIKSNPLYSLAGWVPLTYERFISPNISIVLGASYITNEPPIFPNISKTYETRDGYYVNPAIRFYLFKSSDLPGGFYASPELGWISQQKRLGADSVQVYVEPVKIDEQGYLKNIYYPSQKITSNEFQIGATIGYQWVFRRAFVLDVYAGEGVSIIRFTGDERYYFEHLNNAGYTSKKVPVNGARLIAGAKVGIAF